MALAPYNFALQLPLINAAVAMAAVPGSGHKLIELSPAAGTRLPEGIYLLVLIEAPQMSRIAQCANTAPPCSAPLGHGIAQGEFVQRVNIAKIKIGHSASPSLVDGPDNPYYNPV